MGQSAPTVTQMMDRFQGRYAGFRAGLSRSEQALFDRLVAEGHRHSPSLNSHPELDFERPLFLAMLVGTLERLEREQDRTRRRVVRLEARLDDEASTRRPVPSEENQARLPRLQAQSHSLGLRPAAAEGAEPFARSPGL